MSIVVRLSGHRSFSLTWYCLWRVVFIFYFLWLPQKTESSAFCVVKVQHFGAIISAYRMLSEQYIHKWRRVSVVNSQKNLLHKHTQKTSLFVGSRAHRANILQRCNRRQSYGKKAKLWTKRLKEKRMKNKSALNDELPMEMGKTNKSAQLGTT